MIETNTKPTFTPRLLVQSSAKFHINAPTSAIDITDWLFNVEEAEYIACTPQSASHLSAGFTHAPDGKRMSINIEDVGGALIVEHYVEKIGENSTAESFPLRICSSIVSTQLRRSPGS